MTDFNAVRMCTPVVDNHDDRWVIFEGGGFQLKADQKKRWARKTWGAREYK